MKIFTSIKSKLILMAVLLVLFPSVIFMGHSIRSENRAFEANISEALNTVHRAYENELEKMKTTGMNYGTFFAADKMPTAVSCVH